MVILFTSYKKEVHEDVMCDGCNTMPIHGPRYTCRTCSKPFSQVDIYKIAIWDDYYHDYNLCEDCYSKYYRKCEQWKYDRTFDKHFQHLRLTKHEIFQVVVKNTKLKGGT